MSNLQVKIERSIELLNQAVQDFSPATFANSLGAEDMVLTDLIAKHQPSIEMFSLDTGRLPQETYDLMQTMRTHYSIPLTIYFPDKTQVEEYVKEKGVNGFYDSVDNRKACCHIRKVVPLKRALHGKKAWLTGMRREQAASRANLSVSSFDTDHGLQKINPLLDWTNAEIWEYLKQNEVPYNKMHDHFYPSIGCAPCTRAVTPGEDIRSGRWWWEAADGKECGLHATKSTPLKNSI